VNVIASLIASSIALLSLSANALEIDEKLTLRFLKVSSSKKTILINRGGEDGLVVGDHAKFFITAGVIARGVAEKVSPSRSIWSLYRVVDANEITEDKVLNLKIATPVKITEDSSKSMKEEAIPGGTESMSMGDEKKVESSSTDKEIVVDEADQAELEEMGMEKATPNKSPEKTPAKIVRPETTEVMELPSKMGTNRSDNWEIWGMVYLNSLSGDVESGSDTTDATASTVDFSAGVERYFMNSDSWLKNLSVSLFLHKRSSETGGDVTLTTDWSEYGAAANYHFYNNTYDLNRPVLFVAGSFGLGSVTNESAVATSNTTVTEDGDSKFFSVGIGAKYTMGNGFGGRAILDYYSSAETFTFSDETELTRTLSGPRMQFGLSYRF
jgi:hypothetical protein